MKDTFVQTLFCFKRTSTQTWTKHFAVVIMKMRMQSLSWELLSASTQ